MRQLRLAIVGFGTVGRWLASAIQRRGWYLESEYGVGVILVGVANRRHGFICRDAGFDIPSLKRAAPTPVSRNRPSATFARR
jgi:homoserine dehydrogenase